MMLTNESTTSTQADGTLAEKNAKHFNQVPAEWPQWVHDLHRQIVDFLVSSECETWLSLPSPGGDGARMLDYACGDGIVSKALMSHFATIVGIDVSETMLTKYRATAAELGLGADEMVGVCGDLLSDEDKPTDPPLPREKLHDFDLVVTSMALHHFADPKGAIRKLAALLKVGGVLLVIDWTPLDGSTAEQREYQAELKASGKEMLMKDHAARHTVSKPGGFEKNEMGELFEKAGCQDFGWELAEKLTPIPVVDAKAQLYFARATRRS